jgi:hypothetical protein
MKRINALRCALALAALVVAIFPGTALGGPPSNDGFVNAEVIDGRFGWTDGENTDATKEPGEPNHAGNPGGASVWYSWTAPSTGRATLNLCYAEFDSLLAVYTGDVVSALQEVASNDDGCSAQSQLSFTATSGTTYRIAIDGANGASGYYELGWGLSPSNDDFAQAVPLAGDTGTVAGDNWYATKEIGEPDHGATGGASVWYRWTAPSSGPATFDVCDAYFDSLLAVYTGDNVAVLTRVAQDDNDCDYSASRVSFQATAGVVYSIAVDGSYGEQGEFTFQWSRQALAPRNHVEPSILGVPKDGATLTSNAGEWGGIPPITFGYQWARCSFTGLNCQLIGGATQSTYSLTSSDVGSRIRVFVTATNSGGSATASSESTGIVSPVGPQNVVPPRILDPPYLGEEVYVDEGQWTGTEPLEFNYRWERCNSAGDCVEIDGETSSTHTIVAQDVKSRLRVIVTASNGAGSASAASGLTRRASRRQFCVVPRVQGRKMVAARKAIRRAHCRVGRVRKARSQRPSGRVIAQTPRAGKRLPLGAKVNLVVSRGHSR